MDAHTAELNYLARRQAWIKLSAIPGWGSAAVWKGVGGKTGDPVRAAERYRPLLQWEQLEVESRAAALDVTIVTWDDAAYPRNLRAMECPPPVLYIKGSLDHDDTHAVAIVGSRRATPLAMQYAYDLARHLAAAGLTIVSGLAHGIDEAAHKGALSVGGRTIAVVANGPEVVYPPTHRNLAAQITSRGAIVSQFPCGTPPRRAQFPIRNRTMAGLALGTCVVEAGERSGALITAKAAAELGRVVMACPGDAWREHTIGANRLLRDGALLILEAADVLSALGVQATGRVSQAPGSDLLPNAPMVMGAVPGALRTLAHRLWLQLVEQPCGVDELAIVCQSTPAQVRTCLTHLELNGLVCRSQAGQYCLALAPKSNSMVT